MGAKINIIHQKSNISAYKYQFMPFYPHNTQV